MNRYALTYNASEWSVLMSTVFKRVFRTDFNEPGFAVIDFGTASSSTELRKRMVDLKSTLDQQCQTEFKKKLNYQWLGRFDQQESTKYHLDNSTDQSFLMLGYEPSKIKSKLFLADYSAFSAKRKIKHSTFFEKYNPIYQDNIDLLKDYITHVTPFNEKSYKIVLINNSKTTGSNNTLGVLHMAEVPKPNLKENRVINSIMLNMVDLQDGLDQKHEAQNFIETNLISK